MAAIVRFTVAYGEFTLGPRIPSAMQILILGYLEYVIWSLKKKGDGRLIVFGSDASNRIYRTYSRVMVKKRWR